MLPLLDVKGLYVGFGSNTVVKNLNLAVFPNSVTAIIGPSGCGKSTFIRCINRIHHEIPGAWHRGSAELMGVDVLGPSMDPVEVRRKVGMVFQKPNPFPGLSIFENVGVGPKLTGIKKKSILSDIVETSLKHAALWDEVKDKLGSPATSLSGGQQQRLCIARALAVSPQILLMDEPTSALDPISTSKIEELILDLKKEITILIVTHNMQQASRISDRTAFLLMGDLIEYGDTKQIFTVPKQKETERYITGKFG